MKQIRLLLCAICSFSAAASAQPGIYGNLPEEPTEKSARPLHFPGKAPDYKGTMQRYAFVHSLGAGNGPVAAAKTTTLKQRLTGISWADSTDWAYAAYRKYTVDFYYKNNQRGSGFDYHSMSYLYDYPLDRVPSFQYVVAPADYLGVRSDSSIRKEWCNNTSQQEVRLAYGLSYNEQNNRITGSRKYNVLCGGSLNDVTKTEEAYDAAGRVSERSVYYRNPVSSQWELYGRQFLRYNAAGRKLVDSVASYLGGAWNPENRIVFAYDAAGNPVSISFEVFVAGGFQQQALLESTFYASGEPRTIRLSELAPGGSTVAPSSLDSFGYTAGAPCFTSVLVHNYVGSSPVPVGKQIRHLNAQMRPDSITEYSYSGGQYWFIKLAAYSYNAYGNPVMGRIYPVVNGAISSDTFVVERFAYQEYNESATAASATAAPNSGYTIYPVPARGALTIRCDDGSAGQWGRVRVINANGQTLITEDLHWNNNLHTVQTGGLAPGIYFLMVEGPAGEPGFHRSFVKE